MKRRHLLSLLVLAPLSVVGLRFTWLGRTYLQKDGWVLKSEDL